MTACCVASIGVSSTSGAGGTSRRALWAAALFLALAPIALGSVSLNTYDAWPAFLTVAAWRRSSATGRSSRWRCSGWRRREAVCGAARAGRARLALARAPRGAGPLASFCSPPPCSSCRGSRSRRAGSGTASTRRSGAALHTESLGAACSSPPTGSAGTTRTSSRRLRPCPATSRAVTGCLRDGVGRARRGRCARAGCGLLRRRAAGRASRSRPALPGSSRSRRCSRRSTSCGWSRSRRSAASLRAPCSSPPSCSRRPGTSTTTRSGRSARRSGRCSPATSSLVALYAVLLWKTSTPSRSKTSAQSGLERSRASAAAAGSGATRSA